MKKSFLLYVMLGLGLSQVIAQTTNQIVLQTKKVYQSLNQTSLSFRITYLSQANSIVDFTVLDQCDYFIDQDKRLVLFSSYEEYESDNEYIKVDHQKKEIIRVKYHQTEDGLLQSPFGEFSLANLDRYGIALDSIQSDLSKQKIVFTANEESPYQSIHLIYEEGSNLPIVYTIYYRQKEGVNLYALKLKFEYTAIMNRSLSPSRYFETQEPMHKLKEEYANYNLILN